LYGYLLHFTEGLVMKKILLVLFLARAIVSLAQPVASEKSVLVKPGFSAGDIRSYEVKMDSKIEDPPKVYSKSEEEYQVSFTILDTAGGYTIKYDQHTVNCTPKRWELRWAISQISNGISVIYKMNRQGYIVNYEGFRRLQVQLINALDSLTANHNFSSIDSSVLQNLRAQLYTAEGVEKCLQPLVLFNELFNKPAFRSPDDYSAAVSTNLFFEPYLPGIMITGLKKLNAQQNTAEVKLEFSAQPDSAAKKMTPVFREAYQQVAGKNYKGYIPQQWETGFEREIEIELLTGWPLEIKNKATDRYLVRTVYKTTMKLLTP
jgi:hypothetical protein